MREMSVFDRVKDYFIGFVLVGLDFRYFYNLLVGRSEPCIDLKV